MAGSISVYIEKRGHRRSLFILSGIHITTPRWGNIRSSGVSRKEFFLNCEHTHRLHFRAFYFCLSNWRLQLCLSCFIGSRLSIRRHAIYVIITKFENGRNVLRNLTRRKQKIKKILVETLNGYEKQEEEFKLFLFKKMTWKKYSSSLSRQLSETKSNPKLVRNHCSVSNMKINKMSVTLIYLRRSQSQNNCWHRLISQEWNIKNTPFIQNVNRMASSVDRNHKFCKRTF